ncbi:hypothetical protein [Croceivirga radicis]|uniref:hypothetical protein n=1 Tax=Croceivirga radicis TaxID=1929488 RepID=UPI000255B36B|nr:hypothetical protein [Croceivirga radicis]
MAVKFKEQQQFTQWWLWVLLIGIGLRIGYGVYQQLVLETNFGNNPMSNNGLVIFAVLYALLLFFFYRLKLTVTISNTYLTIHFFPLIKRVISISEIQEAKAKKYSFVGGWGIRYWTKYGTVYNVKGNKGVALKLKNGDRYLIGSQRAKELEYQLLQLGIPIAG